MRRGVPLDAPRSFRQLPGFVATCHWQGTENGACGAPTKLGLRNVTLAVPEHDPPYVLKTVPLCLPHLEEHKVTGVLKLAYHPEQALADQGR